MIFHDLVLSKRLSTIRKYTTYDWNISLLWNPFDSPKDSCRWRGDNYPHRCSVRIETYSQLQTKWHRMLDTWNLCVYTIWLQIIMLISSSQHNSNVEIIRVIQLFIDKRNELRHTEYGRIFITELTFFACLCICLGFF